jgi:hypothetical protein
MECDKSPGDGSPSHKGRNEKDPRRSSEGVNSEREILVDVTGRHNGPSTYGNQDQRFLHPGTQTFVRRIRPVSYQT